MPRLPSAEQGVIEAFLGAQAKDSAPALWETTSAGLEFGRRNGNFQEQLLQQVSSLGEAHAQAVEDLLWKNREAVQIREITNAVPRVHLIPAAAYKNILLDNDASFDEWLLFYERQPGCGRIMIVSRVGFEPKGCLAVLCYALKDPYEPCLVRFQLMRRAGSRWVTAEPRSEGKYERYVCTGCGFQKSVESAELACEWTHQDVTYHPTCISKAIGTNRCQHEWLLYVCGRIDGGEYMRTDLPGGRPESLNILYLLDDHKFASELASMDRPRQTWRLLVTALSTNRNVDLAFYSWSTATPSRTFASWWQQSPLVKTTKP